MSTLDNLLNEEYKTLIDLKNIISISQDTILSNSVTFSSILVVSGMTIFNNNLSMNTNLNILGNSIANGPMTITSNLHNINNNNLYQVSANNLNILKNATFQNITTPTINVPNGVSTFKNITGNSILNVSNNCIANTLTLNSNLYVSGITTLNGILTLDSAYTITQYSILNNLSSNMLCVSNLTLLNNDTTIYNSLYVSGYSLFGSVSLNSNLTISNTTILNYATIMGDLTLNDFNSNVVRITGNINVIGGTNYNNISINSNLLVSGYTNINGNSTVLNNLYVTNNSIISGNISILGNINVTNMSIQDTLIVSGNTILKSLNISGPSTFGALNILGNINGRLKNFDTNEDAANNGIPLFGLYRTGGIVKIRLDINPIYVVLIGPSVITMYTTNIYTELGIYAIPTVKMNSLDIITSKITSVSISNGSSLNNILTSPITITNNTSFIIPTTIIPTVNALTYNITYTCIDISSNTRLISRMVNIYNIPIINSITLASNQLAINVDITGIYYSKSYIIKFNSITIVPETIFIGNTIDVSILNSNANYIITINLKDATGINIATKSSNFNIDFLPPYLGISNILYITPNTIFNIYTSVNAVDAPTNYPFSINSSNIVSFTDVSKNPLQLPSNGLLDTSINTSFNIIYTLTDEFGNNNIVPININISPLPLTGIYYWIDPSNLNTLKMDSKYNLASITDISGTNVKMIPFVGIPKIKLNAINGLSVLDFTNSSSLVSNNTYPNSYSVTLAIIVNFYQPTNWGAIWGHFNNHDNDISLRNTYYQNNINWHTNNDNSVVQLQFLPSIPVMYIGVLVQGTYRYFKMINLMTGNEISITGSNPLTMNLANCPFRLGSSEITTELSLCDVGECMYWKRVLNSVEIYNISQYLFRKWGKSTATLNYTSLPYTIALNGPNPYKIKQNGLYTEYGITINSMIDSTLVPVITGTYDLSTIGTYTITYTINNFSSTQSISRTINVFSNKIMGYDTSNGNLQINSGLNFNVLNGVNWTIECWINMYKNNTTNISAIIDFGQPNNDNPYLPSSRFWMEINNNKVGINAMGNSTTGLTINKKISFNSWTHVVCMRYNNNIYSFINGFASPGEGSPGYLNGLNNLTYIVIGNAANWVYNPVRNYGFLGQISQPLITLGAKYNISGFIPSWDLTPSDFSNVVFFLNNNTDLISSLSVVQNLTVSTTTFTSIPVSPILTLNGNSLITLSLGATQYIDPGITISDPLGRDLNQYNVNITSITDIYNNELLQNNLNGTTTNTISNAIINTSLTTIIPNNISKSIYFTHDQPQQNLSGTLCCTSSKWTISFWIYSIRNGGVLYSNNGSALIYREGNTLGSIGLTDNGTTYLQLANVNLPDGWVHVVFNYDTTQTDPTKRYICYLNNVLTLNNGRYSASGSNLYLNQVLYDFKTPTKFFMGTDKNLNNQINAYISQFIFVDNLVLTPDNFGYFYNNVWITKPYSGTFGAYGVYLNFSNSAIPGLDISGNNKNWTNYNVLSKHVVAYNICPQIAINNTNIITSNATIYPLNLYTITYSLNNYTTKISRIVNILNFDISNPANILIPYNNTNITTTFNAYYQWGSNFIFSNNNMYGGLYSGWAINPLVINWFNFNSSWSIIMKGTYLSIGNYRRFYCMFDPEMSNWVPGLTGDIGGTYNIWIAESPAELVFTNGQGYSSSKRGVPWTMMLSGFYIIFRRDNNGYVYFTMTDINQNIYYDFKSSNPTTFVYYQSPIAIQQMVNYQWEKGILVTNNTTATINDWINAYGV